MKIFAFDFCLLINFLKQDSKEQNVEKKASISLTCK